MSNRHERRKATAEQRARLKTAKLDQHFDNTLRRVRAEFERTGEIPPRFECVTEGESFHVLANWPDRSAKAAVCAALRDSFRRRGVNRYVFASEAWVSKTPGVAPADDPDRGECVQVIAVERNGLRRYAFAEVTRNGDTAALGPWEVKDDVPQGWLLELLEEGHSDRASKAEPPAVGIMSRPDFQDLVEQHPDHAAEFLDSVEITDQLIADEVQKLRQVGLRSSFELDDEEGHVFIALSADPYPIGVMGWRNAVGDLFVTSVVYPPGDFATAVEDIKQSGAELILGSEAKELLRKMQQVEGFALRDDKNKRI